MKQLTPYILLLLIFSCSKKISKSTAAENAAETSKTNTPIEKEIELSPDQKVVFDFIQLVKNNEKEKLSERVRFPLSREHPLPEIKNKKEFLARYDEVFDKPFKTVIQNSDPIKDWSTVGSRGIMLQSGKLWLTSSGKLIAVNYQSNAEKIRKEELIKQDRQGLHASIQTFEEPVLSMETKKFKIRIDDLGDYNYRYASWSIEKSMESKPDLIVENGDFVPDGSGGNHYYEFKNGQYRYVCYVIVLGERDSPPAVLQVYQGKKLILDQNAVSLQN